MVLNKLALSSFYVEGFIESIELEKMESSGLLTLLEQLDDEIDDLEESLAPVLNTALAATSSKLPLLDKAKLYILVTYGIESVLFCRLLGLTLWRLKVYSQNFHSVPTVEWCQSSRACRFQRIDSSQAIF
jgi:hypothetical protein